MTYIQAVELPSTVLTPIQLPFTVLGGGGSDTITAPPLVEKAAEGSSQLDTEQRAAVLGEVIPIVFCRRVDEIGGVLISPPATEARFEDNSSGDVTASYHLVLAEGRIDSIQVRDVFQRACRVGSHTQTYDKRAGTFVPGNFIDESPGLEAPYYCGTGGSYAGLSTMAFTITIPAGFDQWNRQVHCFVRGGLWVTRILDNVTGPSNNVVDLLLYLLQTGSRVSADQIDNDSFLAAAQFTDTNGFWYNGIEDQSTNVRDWMASTLPLFLLRSSRVNGKQALRPLLKATATGAIDTSPVDIAFVFTEEHIIPDGFEIQYTSLADRKPICVQVLWRQQPTDDIGIIRTTDVRYADTAEDGPFEQHDLSRFCASEDHAVKVGTYILSRRRHISHRLSIGVKPDSFNETLAPGDIVRVKLDRVASTGANSVHDYLYEVEQVGKSVTGAVQLQLTEFPVDAERRSVVAQEVATAVGKGILLPTGKNGVTCDVNSSSDTSIPADTSIGGWSATGTDANGDPYTVDWAEGGSEFEAGTDDESGISNGITEISTSDSDWQDGSETDNAEDNKSQQAISNYGLTSSGDLNMPRVGDTVTAPMICEGGRVTFYRNTPTGRVQVAQGTSTYTMVINDVDYSVYSEIECPDPSSPTGYGPPTATSSVGPVYPAPSLPDANVYGTYSPTGANSLIITSGWSGDGPQFIGGSDCIPKTFSGGSTGTASVTGIQGFRIVKGGAGLCGGFGSLALQVQNAAGVWTQIASIGGGNTGWKKFTGSIEISSTAPDAIPAYLGNFGGTSNPP